MRKWLILTHRWLGIALSLFFLMWFVSGIVMAFTGGMPELTAAERLAHLAPLDLTRVGLSPAEAVARSGRPTGGRLLLLTVNGRPAYRIVGGRAITIFADTGERAQEMEDADSVAVAAAFLRLPAPALHHVEILDNPDQWTIELRRQMPLHKIVADDDARSEVYVSEESGEVALVTTRRSRALAWAGAIPHWLYLKAIRANDAWWRGLVLWSSGLGIVSGTIGVVLAFTQYRVRYRGWLRWHYWTGAVVGVFAVTWVFSGWLSMEPWYWASGGGTGGRIGQSISGVLDLSRYPAFDRAAWDEALAGSGVGAIKEIEFRSVLDVPYYIVRGTKTVMVSASPLEVRREPFAADALMPRVAGGNRGVPITAVDVLTDYDAYYYDQDRTAPLPALRVKFDDAAATWAYVDLRFGQMRQLLTRRQRVNRWLYHGLHDLDFAFWYYNRPVWYGAIVVLCLGGAMLSTIGIVIGWKRLRRTVSGATSTGQA